MSKNQYSGLGDQIRDIVEGVVDTRNFEKLNRDITDTVNSALWEVHNSLKNGFQSAPNDSKKDPQVNVNDVLKDANKTMHQAYNSQAYNRTANKNSAGYNNQASSSTRQVKVYPQKSKLPVAKNPKGNVAGILYSVFGWIGAGTIGFIMSVFGLVTLMGRAAIFNPISVGVMLPFFLACVIMIGRGGTLRKRVKRFRKYAFRFKDKSYCTIKELAAVVGKSERFVLKDINKMISLKMFPEGRIDDQKTCLMLTNELYDQYLKTQEEMKKRQEEEAKRQEEEARRKEELANENEESRAFRAVIDEGKEYIRQIKDANIAIVEVELSNKLDRLETIISKIFGHVEKHPEQVQEIRKFMSYYLPTTLKLVNTYREFDTQPIQGENISSAKNEIRKTLDTINLAFENLLDSLFEAAAMDVSTDISVLKTMLAQEGLAEKDFEGPKLEWDK